MRTGKEGSETIDANTELGRGTMICCPGLVFNEEAEFLWGKAAILYSSRQTQDQTSEQNPFTT